jgi:hypothetical protein
LAVKELFIWYGIVFHVPGTVEVLFTGCGEVLSSGCGDNFSWPYKWLVCICGDGQAVEIISPGCINGLCVFVEILRMWR